MAVVNVSLPTTNKYFAVTLPVPELVITKFNKPTSHDLAFNPCEMKIAIDAKRYAVSKSLSMRHAPNLESFNNEEFSIDKSTQLIECHINHHYFDMKNVSGDGK